eukprot:11254223-Ditylum_brightwellii.AAC.1
MQKTSGEKAMSDEENAEVFAAHFNKVFNNPDLLPCDELALPFVPTQLEFTHLGEPPSIKEVRNAILCMCNGKALDPSGITSDAFH